MKQSSNYTFIDSSSETTNTTHSSTFQDMVYALVKRLYNIEKPTHLLKYDIDVLLKVYECQLTKLEELLHYPAYTNKKIFL